MEEIKQVILLRTDLKLSIGKACAQACHCSLGAYKKAGKKEVLQWEREGEKKVALQVKDEKELISVFESAKKAGLPAFLVRDAGRTEIPAGTLTALGIGPAESGKIDRITGGLKLLG